MGEKFKILILILIFISAMQKGICAEQVVPLKKITSINASHTVKNKAVVVKSQPTQQPQPIQPQPVDFSLCNKTFKLDSERLFYLTLAAVNANRFKLDEIQSKSGYVLFTVAKKQYLASVIIISSKTSMLKITPCDNIYIFPVGIVQNMFKYIELNSNTPVEKLNSAA